MKSALLLVGCLFAAYPSLSETSAGRLSLEITPPVGNLPFAQVGTQTESATRQPARKPDILYVPTPENMVEEMLTTAKVGKDDVIYDLGCGDGRIVITAAAKYGARGIGIDIDPQRISEAQANAEKAGVTDRVTFKEADIFQSDFRDASVVALYLLTSLNQKLRPKILAETKPGTRIVSHAFSMGDWEADDYKMVEGRQMFYWVVPANMTGRWKVNAEGPKGAPASLFIQQKFQKISGTAEIDGKNRNITEGKVTGESFVLKLQPAAEGESPLTVSGQIQGDTLRASSGSSPETTWTAQREAGTKQDIATAAAK